MNKNNFMEYPLQNFFKSLEEQGKVKRLSTKESYEVAKEIEDSMRDFSRRYTHEQGKFRQAC